MKEKSIEQLLISQKEILSAAWRIESILGEKASQEKREELFQKLIGISLELDALMSFG
ncbi:MAG: hypothetical protein V1819_00400 [bacterium]